MEKQTSIMQIPINTRTIGKPSGIYVLYLEDYVYTFINKLLTEKINSDNVEFYEVSLYGKRFDEDGRSFLVISGAAQNPFPEDKGKLVFPSCTFIGNAKIEANKASGLRLDIAVKNTNIVLDDFYIYYAQNEEMQNYLIEWNASHISPQDNAAMHAEHKNMSNIRAASDDTARYSRLAQAYNREEAKVSFIWNVMNILCLGLVLCIMVYGIISINNYHKMKNMEKTIDYCLALITDNIQLKNDYKAPASVTIEESAYERLTGDSTQNKQVPHQTETAKATETETAQLSETMPAIETETTQPSTIDETVQPTSQPATDNESETLNQTITPSQTATEAIVRLDQEIPQTDTDDANTQYYIVQQGDTLRTISYDVYGTYNMVDEICEWNKIENPDNILYGQRLLLPEK